MGLLMAFSAGYVIGSVCAVAFFLIRTPGPIRKILKEKMRGSNNISKS